MIKPQHQHVQQVVEKTAREQWGYLYACLVKQFHSFDLAEDTLQEAMVSALEHWPVQGIPEVPRAWLLQIARRKAIDRLRRQTRYDSKQDMTTLLDTYQDDDTVNNPEEIMDQQIKDERLKLIFTCCHPALSESAHIALTLRTLGGLSVPDIARAFLVPKATLAQRLVRAKAKIRKAGIPYKVPDSSQWPERLGSVLAVIYLIFNEGYSASNGEQLVRTDLCEEAVSLAQMLNQLIPDNPEVMGLLALMLLHDSRRAARLDARQNYLSLEQQNRDFWDQKKISIGKQWLHKALRLRQPGIYQLQAAISAVHTDASNFAATDWQQIRLLYNRLYALKPSPVIQLNAIVALSYERGPEVALAAMNEVDFTALANYQPYHSARADILNRSEQLLEAEKAYQQAVALSRNKSERGFLEQQLSAVQRRII